MPNTPCLIGQAASAYVLGNHATLEDGDRAFALFSSVGARPGVTVRGRVGWCSVGLNKRARARSRAAAARGAPAAPAARTSA